MIKIVLYLIIIPIVIWSMDSINFHKIMRHDKPYQARVFYMLLVFGLSSLILNFILDFSNIN